MRHFIVDSLSKSNNVASRAIMCLSLFLFSSSFVFAVDFTTVQDGNWSNATTWDGNGVPMNLESGDRILIRNTVTSLVDINIPDGVTFIIEETGTFNNNDTDEETTQKPTIEIDTDVTFSGTFINNDGGTVDFGGMSLSVPTGGTLNNMGLFNFDGGATNISIEGTFNNSGNVEIDDAVAGEIQYSFGNNATFSGDGSLEGNLAIPGTLSPGNSIGTINITGSLSVSGTIEIEVSGSSNFDIINVTGNIDLSGATVVVTFLSYFPSSLESYNYLTFSSSSGTTPSYDLPTTVSWNTSTFGTFEVTAILPVELTTFEASLENEQVSLFWKTANELNNSGFEVQHSTDGLAWNKIGFLDGVGTTLVTQQYDFVHRNPSSGVNYYRLKQIDFDGQFEYSNIVSIQLSSLASGSFLLFPNPSATKISQLDLRGTDYLGQPMSLYNGMGQLLWQRTIKEEIETLDFSQLSNGTYFLTIQKGEEVIRQKIIIQ